jgi:hypothetical protein
MLQEGKISVEEATVLLRQFPEQQQREHHEYHGYYDDDEDEDKPTLGTGFDFSSIGETISNAMSDAFETVNEAVKDAGDFAGDYNWSGISLFGINGKHKNEMMFVSDPIAGDIAAIRLLGKNSPVEVKGYPGNQVRIKVKYTPKRHGTQIFVREDGGVFELLYDYNAMRGVDVECLVPAGSLVGSIHAETKNAKIEIEQITANQMELITKNEKIELADVICPQIIARTRNAKIDAKRVQSEHMDLQTNNAKIDVKDTKAKIARLTTSNAKVSTERIDIEQLYIKTSNGGIKLEDAFNAATFPVSEMVRDPQRNPNTAPSAAETAEATFERVIEAQTSNASVTISIPYDTAINLQASTSNARIDCKLPNLLVSDMSKNYLYAKTHNYETRPKRVKLTINTSNAAIKVKEAI